ncbi:MAG: hypothetical protein ACFFB0_09510 [Promethearchaeota archaeon]
MKRNTTLSFFVLILLSSIGILSINSIGNTALKRNSYMIPKINLKDALFTSLGTSWDENGIAVTTANEDQFEHQVISDGSGGVIIVWKDDRSETNDDIYTQRIDSDGNVLWTLNGTAICTEGSNQYPPVLCSDGAGGAIIAWHDSRNGNSDIFAQRIKSNGVIQWTVNGVPVCVESNDQIDQQICSDGAGGAIITWVDYRPASGNAIYAQRIDSNGDAKWTVNGIPLTNEIVIVEYPQICSDGAGGAIIAWTKNLGSGNYDVYAQRINFNGVDQWTTNGEAISTAPGSQRSIKIINNKNGGAVMVWDDYRSLTFHDIYAQSIDANGIVQWTVNGTPICVSGLSSFYPEFIVDEDGGSIITWQDVRNLNFDVYAQYIDSNGSIQWKVNGIAICATNENEETPQICSDGGGGAIISWIDTREIGYNVYAQRVTPEGDLKWATNGIMITNVTDMDNTEKHLIVSDGLGGAIFTWERGYFFGDADIYAQRLENDAPTSSHPEDIKTSTEGSEEINWTLSDDTAGGKYRVLANDTNGDYHITVNWTSWTSGNELLVSIDNENVGEFNYTIQYYDDQNRFGIPDTIIVIITKAGFKIGGYNLIFLIISFFAIAFVLTKKSKILLN